VRFPPHVIFALTAVPALLVLGAVALWAVAKSRGLSPLAKRILGAIMVAVVLTASAWLVFVLPVYWD
jgi:hypothetical protein